MSDQLQRVVSFGVVLETLQFGSLRLAAKYKSEKVIIYETSYALMAHLCAGPPAAERLEHFLSKIPL